MRDLAKNKTDIKYFCFMLAAVFGYCEIFNTELTNDTNFFMHCALRLWRFGAGELYDRCTDENFPYHIMFYAPLAGLSVYLHTNPAHVLHAVCTLCCIGNLFVLNHVLKAQRVDDTERNLWLAISAFTLLVVPCAYGVFGDREHFLFILGLPWMIQKLLRVRPLNYTAVLAGLGFCMKPHDFAIFAILTLVSGPAEWSLRQRIFSASSWIIGAIALLYAGVIYVFFPQFIHDIIPMSVTVYPTKYIAFGTRLTFAKKYIFVAFAAVFIFVRPYKEMAVWLGFIFACALVFFFNGGWEYTYYLTVVPMLLACATPWFPRFAERYENNKGSVKVVKVVLAVMLFFSSMAMCADTGLITVRALFRYHNNMNAPLYHALRRAAGDKFISLSVNLWSSNIETFGGPPEAVFSYDNMWTYLWLHKHKDDPHYPLVFHALTSSVLRAIKENPTAVIIEDTTAASSGAPDHILDFLKQDPEVVRAMAPYVVKEKLDYCSAYLRDGCQYTVWQRADVKAPDNSGEKPEDMISSFKPYER